MTESEENKSEKHFKWIGEKKNPFSVPDHYFEKLPNEIHKRISEDKVSWKEQLLTILLKPQLAVIASLLIFVLIALLVFFSEKNGEHIADTNSSKTGSVILAGKPDSLFEELANTIKKEDVKMRDLEPIESHVVMEEMASSSVLEPMDVDIEKGMSFNSNDEINYLLDSDVDVYDIMDELNRD